MDGRRGFTLIEIMAACALMAALFLMAGNSFLGLLRMSRYETAVMEMDRDANQALGTLNSVLRRAVLPISAPDNPGGVLALLGDEFAAHGGSWREILNQGDPLLAYVVPVDYDGDGDVLDGFGNPEFGIEPPSGRSRPAARAGRFCPDLGGVSPDDLGLVPGVSDLDLDAPCFAADFSFPGGGDAVYEVIRFVPYREGGAPLILEESELAQDLNEDRDLEDRFALGRLEIDWLAGPDAPRTQSVTSESLLLGINRSGDHRDSLFQLGDFDPAGNPAASGQYAVKVQLLLCNYLAQREDKPFFGRGMPLITRAYQTIIKLRLMSLK
ncbi:MAG: prepilin-type N-terminal cleavage/methylation domain-containing protein [Planctomycetota bacterium]|jgi:prepilin-type N-terminal cleavage/methylation domain-containing protein|nr:prepilin-type N-terminal cleavage/methylation domain-containing protein [Planctomycetota bacterium]